MKAAREIAAQALAITAQDWTCLGFSDDPQVEPTSSVDVITDRIVSLLAIRSIAVLSTLEEFNDFSTTTICRAILLNENCWPAALTDEILGEMRAYVKRIIEGYNDTPYHNREHAYHVVLSANKLLDLMLNPEFQDNGHERHRSIKRNSLMMNGEGNHKSSSIRRNNANQSTVPRTFGLRRDTLLQFTLIFAALIHDVQHGGVSNRQLTLEDDPLSLLYNDSSVLEQQSLTIAFTEFLQPEFAKLRKAILPTRDIYSGFRQTVVNLVLATDIANPERMQVTKDKWKTAFGDVEQNEDKARRESAITEITLPRQNNPGRESRRRSIGSIFSDITVDANITGESNLLGALSSGDEASLSATPDSSENEDIYGPFGSSAISGSSEGIEEVSSDGLSGSHLHSNTPDSLGTRSLQKIEESERAEVADPGAISTDDEVTSQELGYSIPHTKQNGNLSPKSEGYSPPVASSMSISQRSRNARRSRRGSTTNIPDGLRGVSGYRRRRASVSAGDNLLKRMQQRLSASSCKSTGSDIYNGKKFRQRLGIMRSLDLGGETIENFSRKSSICSTQSKFPLEDYDEPDELRAIVVLETMLLSCDVAHNLQGWNHMLKWSHRLYWELENANVAGRGFDPSPGWVNGQTGFLQGYMLPLAQKLGGTGVFGKQTGGVFANVVQDILDQWKIQGEGVTDLLINSRELDLEALNSLTYSPEEN